MKSLQNSSEKYQGLDRLKKKKKKADYIQSKLTEKEMQMTTKYVKNVS